VSTFFPEMEDWFYVLFSLYENREEKGKRSENGLRCSRLGISPTGAEKRLEGGEGNAKKRRAEEKFVITTLGGT